MTSILREPFSTYSGVDAMADEDSRSRPAWGGSGEYPRVLVYLVNGVELRRPMLMRIITLNLAVAPLWHPCGAVAQIQGWGDCPACCDSPWKDLEISNAESHFGSLPATDGKKKISDHPHLPAFVRRPYHDFSSKHSRDTPGFNLAPDPPVLISFPPTTRPNRTRQNVDC